MAGRKLLILFDHIPSTPDHSDVCKRSYDRITGVYVDVPSNLLHMARQIPKI